MSGSEFVYFVGTWHSSVDYSSWSDEKSTTIVAIVLGDAEYASPLPNASVISTPEEATNWLLRYNVTRVPCCVEIRSNGDVVKSDIAVHFTPVEDISSLAHRAIEAYNDYRINEAATCYVTLLHHDASHVDALFNIASIFHMHSFIPLALPYLEQLLLLTPNDMVVHAFLWALSQSSARGLVIDVYHRLSRAGNVIATHKLAALQGSGVASCSPEYAQHVFDNMAEMFEKRLVTDLEYHCPWTMRDMLSHHLSSMSGLRVLDLGCGSGLCGRLLHEVDASIVLTGVDISSKMIEITRSYNVYRTLLVEDIALELKRHHEYDVIICADTFLYIGALGEVMHHTYRSLSPGGLFIFSTEDLDASPMRTNCNGCATAEHEPAGDMNEYLQLLSSARFAHSAKYISALAGLHGFDILEVKDIIVRKEQTVPLPGKIYLLKKV